MKQVNAFPPNFVHSLDASHMMLTALNCHYEGITFSAVHDCYWTHACDVDRMNAICRQQCVKLHSEPILQQLSDHLGKFLDGTDGYPIIAEGYRDELRSLLDTIPEQGDFDLNKVKQSTYFFC
jgi:DNA-directed RNA polymerase